MVKFARKLLKFAAKMLTNSIVSGSGKVIFLMAG